MKNFYPKRILALGASVCLAAASLPVVKAVEAEAVSANGAVSSVGTADGLAHIRGDGAGVMYDPEHGSNVLKLKGDGFGEGWLQLPAMFIVNEDGVVEYANYARNIVDLPTVDEVLAML